MRFAGSATGLLRTIDFANQIPSYDAISEAADDGRSLERKAATYGAARVAGSGLEALGVIAAAEEGAAATRANGQASLWSSIGSGLMDAAGSVGSGIIAKNKGLKPPGPKTTPGAPIGSQMYGGSLINTGMSIG